MSRDCSTPCDFDCPAVCHEAHVVDYKRQHDVVDCVDSHFDLAWYETPGDVTYPEPGSTR